MFVSYSSMITSSSEYNIVNSSSLTIQSNLIYIVQVTLTKRCLKIKLLCNQVLPSNKLTSTQVPWTGLKGFVTEGQTEGRSEFILKLKKLCCFVVHRLLSRRAENIFCEFKLLEISNYGHLTTT